MQDSTKSHPNRKPYQQMVRFQKDYFKYFSPEDRPANLLVNGDIAYLNGGKHCYDLFKEKLSSILNGNKLNVHFSMGNHDYKPDFYLTYPSQKKYFQPTFSSRYSKLSWPFFRVPNGRHCYTIKLPNVNLHVLDTSLHTYKRRSKPIGHGEVGREQLNWLNFELQQEPRKPSIVFGHHNVDSTDKNHHSLKDWRDLWLVMLSNGNAEAYISGHLHVWRYESLHRIHCVNLPSTVYGNDFGWVLATFGANETVLKYYCFGEDDPRKKQVKQRSLEYRRAFRPA